MKQTALKWLKKPDSLPTGVSMRHGAIRTSLDQQLPPASAGRDLPRGRDFSQLPVTSRGTARASQSCSFTPQRCPFGGACHTCPVPAQASPATGLQRKAANNDRPSAIPPVVHDVLKSPGQPLDKAARASMEPRFGRDFGDVRVHTDATAAESARAVNALAYTVGRHIVFDSGRYAADAAQGSELLSHELTHVVQQGDKQGTVGPDRVSPSSDSYEAEACRNAASVSPVSSQPERLKASRTPSLALQRQPGANPAQDCAWTSLEQAKDDIRVDIEVLIVLMDQSKWLNDLFITLKKARKCFPGFTEDEFVSLSTETAILQDGLRKQIASGHGAAARKDDRRLIWAESKKPFAGYTLSGFDAARRFTEPTRLRQMGARPAPGHKTAPEFTAGSAQTAKESFESADVLVFSGHQYAQYKAPGVWTDSQNTGWDLRRVPGPLRGVKLIVSTSCATLCSEAYNVWKPLFPNATVLGYKKSAPLEGGAIASSFAGRLPTDMILDSGGVSSAVSTWKSVVSARHRGDAGTQPGWLEVGSGTMEYWNGKNWVSLNASDGTNVCYVKGDYSADWPDPRAATP